MPHPCAKLAAALRPWVLALSLAGALFGLPVPAAAQTPPLVVQFEYDQYQVSEGDGQVAVNVILWDTVNNAPATAPGDLSVKVRTGDGTAMAGSDYTAIDQTVQFKKGDSSQTVIVTIIDDSDGEFTENFYLQLYQPVHVGLGTPAVAWVSILDNDPMPTVTINITGVAAADKQNPGGYVSVNANNDNGSRLNDRPPAILPDTIIQPGIPRTRDFSAMNLTIDDPDLAEVTLSAQNLGVNDTLKLRVAKDGRGKIRVWDTPKKQNEIVLPKTYANAAALPQKVYVEGTKEGQAEREVDLRLEVIRANAVFTDDKVLLTITPVLQEVKVAKVDGDAPVLVNTRGNWSLETDNTAGNADPAFQMSAKAIMKNVRGSLNFVQFVKLTNKLANGLGATRGTDKFKWDFGGADAGQKLLDVYDATKYPLYTLSENTATAGNVTTYKTNDSPSLLFNGGPITDVRPAVGGTTNVDVVYDYETYAVVSFTDPATRYKSIYFLGKVTWNVRYQGALKQAVANTFTFDAGAANKNNPSAGAVTLDNTDYALKGSAANAGRQNWYAQP